MLSNIFARLLPTVRPIHNCQQHLIRLLSTAEAISSESSSNSREKGVVKRFSKEKGFGFISKTSDGTDYFVHFKNINATGFKTLEQGQEVEFTAAQGDKGLEAKDVNILSITGNKRNSWLNSASDDESSLSDSKFGNSTRNRSSSSSLFNFGGTRSSSKFNSDEQESTFPEKSFKFNENSKRSKRNDLFSSNSPQTTGESTREFGSVKRWTAERGFGFIRRANSGQDLFCHVRSLKDGLRELEPGQSVEYTVEQTEKGEEARDVTVLEGDSLKNLPQQTTTTTNLGERQKGTVKKWLFGRGFGFVQPEDGGSDIFVHVQSLNNGIQSLEEGQTVEFNLGKTSKGVAAQNVTVISESKNEDVEKTTGRNET